MATSSVRVSVTLSDYQAVRDETESLAAPLSPEDQQIQSMPDVSPTKWHRAHITWFFETFLLLAHMPGYEPFDEQFQFLYNSYYEAVGDRHARHERGLISRPSAEEIAGYRAHVDSAMVQFISEIAAHDTALAELVILGLHHEQQHQELLLMDIKHVLSKNPTRPSYHAQPDVSADDPAPLQWHEFAEGVVEIGYDGNEFHFDNEGPRHRVFLEPFAISDRLITNGEWLDFMADDGYHTAANWLSAGWATVQDEAWQAPMYWQPTSSGWHMHTLHGFVPVDRNEPVSHISYYEADAYARWAGSRLPTEAEWEHATASLIADGGPSLAKYGRFHPSPSSNDTGYRQAFGEVWQWTSSSYNAYPGYRPAEGAVGEYNGKFMVNQYVLRGSCCATSVGHDRPTYRNFFPAHSRWMFGGLRLAKNVKN